MPLERILVVEDDPHVSGALREILRRMGMAVTDCDTLQDAGARMAREKFDIVFLDLGLPDGNGEDLLKRVDFTVGAPFFVIMTGQGSVESAVRCMRAGAFDYLMKPFTAGIIEVVVRRMASFRRLQRVNRVIAGRGDDYYLIGSSPAMDALRDVIEKVAPTDATVLITGESGSGKEIVATEIFRRSNRTQAPFIKVNCAAVTESLMESEFFGHERGAFTGANERREGRFELADGGTLLLDEISEVPVHLQAKLLRVLQEREFERVGGNKTIKVDVRVLATSNRDLAESVEAGRFRQDLYYRLNVVPIAVPPLRDRGGDPVLLAKEFLGRVARKSGLQPSGFSPAAIASIRECEWPGNVRELENAVERAVILVGDSRAIEPIDLGLTSAGMPMGPLKGRGGVLLANGEVPQKLEEVEKAHILSMLERFKGNRTHAAAALGISLRTMRNKLAVYRGESIPAKESGE